MQSLAEIVRHITGAKSVELGDVIQSLWSGYGVIQRAELVGVEEQEHDRPLGVVIKHVDLSRARSNRRGWGGSISHRRKVKSYQVEKTFYESFANRCDRRCTVPRFVASHEIANSGGWVLILSDLDLEGYDCRKSQANAKDVQACLTWLANFHATFINETGTELWPIGTYWNLDTRPDEFAAMPEGRLKRAAKTIDRRLNEAKFQTLVHGDAKIANFCFEGRARAEVAAVDFQYVGRGCGMKDVAYFISSCFDESEAARQQDALLSFYFEQLENAFAIREIRIDFSALEREWRELYAVAWADFCRFLSGWSPDHWKLNAYSDQVTETVLDQLDEASPNDE
ncbi:phosphotransferase [Roseiconus lacunae]|uniref:phosphotransferase n=1 Tax=Roseiconus lacunae TaxID=2605694 RepID=UPI001E63CFA3|nr:phosphotransferase [Roseiconus lacunae]MCD0462787.1 phosphotransferase [Roseiconus lacunae]